MTPASRRRDAGVHASRREAACRVTPAFTHLAERVTPASRRRDAGVHASRRLVPRTRDSPTGTEAERPRHVTRHLRVAERSRRGSVTVFPRHCHRGCDSVTAAVAPPGPGRSEPLAAWLALRLAVTRNHQQTHF